MAEEVQIKASLDQSDAVKGLTAIEKEVKKTANTIGGLESKAEALRNELQGVSVGSAEFKKLAKEARKVDAQLRNAKAELEGFTNKDRVGALGDIYSGITQTTGGFALFATTLGDGNEALEENLNKFVAYIGLIDASEGVFRTIRGLREADTLATIKNTGAKVINATVTAAKNAASGASIALTAGVTAALGAQTVASGAASVATGVLGAAMAIALAPITLIIAAITAVVAAFAYFTSSSEDSTQASKDLSKSIEKQNELREKQAKLAERVAEQELKIAKIQGKNADEILEAEKKVLKTKEENRKKEIKQNIDQHAKLKKMRKKLLAQGNDERASELAQEMDAIKKKNKELKSQEGQYYDDIKVLDEQRKADLEQLADDLSDAELSELDKRLDDNKEYYDALILEAGENEDLVAKIKEQRTKKEDEIRQEDRRKRAKEYKQILRDREEAERELRDVNIELIADDAERERAEFVAQQEDRLAEIEKTYGKESELAQQFRDKQVADLKAYDEQVKAEAEAKVQAEKKKQEDEAKAKVQEAFDLQQRIDEAKLAAKEAGLAEGDVDGLLAINESRFQEEMETLRFQLEQGEIVQAEFDALEKQRVAEHEAEINAIKKQALDEELKNKQAVENAKFNAASASINAVSNLVKAFAKEDEASQRKAFQANKAMQIASAVMDTYRGANAIFASAAANPASILFPAQPFIMAGAAIASGLANVATIAKQKFQGASGGNAPSTPSGGSGAAPSFSLPTNTGGLPSGLELQQTGGQGSQQLGTNQQAPTGVTKVVVLESEITTAQNNVAAIEDAATFN